MLSLNKRTRVAIAALLVVGIAAVVWRRTRKDTARSAAEREQGQEISPGNKELGDRLARGLHRLTGNEVAGAQVEVPGIVVDATTGEPVSGVDVVFKDRRHMETTATSGGDGAFRVAIAAGPYRVRALGDHLFAPSHLLDIPAQGTGRPIEIQVMRLATVDGRVIDAAGKPVAGAAITFRPERKSDRVYLKTEEIQSGVQSGSDGAFEMDVTPGQVVIEADAGGLVGATAVSAAAPGAAVEGVVIRLPNAAALAGFVRDPSGSRVAGATVVAQVQTTDRLGSQKLTATTDSGGAFRFDPITPGKVVLEARAEDRGASAPTKLRLDDREGATRDDIELTLLPGEVLAGRVIRSDGAPVVDARVTASRPRSAIAPQTITTGSDGTFRMVSIAGGALLVTAEAAGYAPARVDGVTPPREDLTLTLASMGGLRGQVKLAKGGIAGDFSVQIVSAKTPAGVAIKVAQKSRRFVSQRGEYELYPLEPGEYEVHIAAAEHGAATARATVPPDGWGDGNITLGVNAELTGRVVDASGAPLAGARVSVPRVGEPVSTFSDDDGRYRLTGVELGRRSLEMSHTGYVAVSRSIEVVPGDNRVDIKLASADGAEATDVHGIGAVIAQDSGGGILVRSVVKEGPAALAGLRKGDVITSVDGVQVTAMTLIEASGLIRGEPGTSVRIEVIRRTKETASVEIVRGAVRAPVTRRGLLVLGATPATTLKNPNSMTSLTREPNV